MKLKYVNLAIAVIGLAATQALFAAHPRIRKIHDPEHAVAAAKEESALGKRKKSQKQDDARKVRARPASALSHAPTPHGFCPISFDAEMVDELPVFDSWADLNERFEAIKSLANYADQIEAFKLLGAPAHDETGKEFAHAFWVPTPKNPELWLKVEFNSAHPYFSEAIAASSVCKGKSSPHSRLVIKEVIDGVEEEVLVLRLNKRFAEVVWIAKGKQLSGSEIAEIFKSIKPIFLVKNWYLYDDAHISYVNKAGASGKILLKLLALGNVDGRTFYEKYLGFSAFNIDARKPWRTTEMPICAEDPSLGTKVLWIAQNQAEYSAALIRLRKMSVAELLKISAQYGTHEHLMKLAKKYGAEEQTLQQLLAAIERNARESAEGCEMIFMYNSIFAHYAAGPSDSPEAVIFFNDVATVMKTRVYGD